MSAAAYASWKYTARPYLDKVISIIEENLPEDARERKWHTSRYIESDSDPDWFSKARRQIEVDMGAAGTVLNGNIFTVGEIGSENIRSVPAGFGIYAYEGYRPDIVPLWHPDGRVEKKYEIMALWTIDQRLRCRRNSGDIKGPLYATSTAASVIRYNNKKKFGKDDLLGHCDYVRMGIGSRKDGEFSISMGKHPNMIYNEFGATYNLVRVKIDNYQDTFSIKGNEATIIGKDLPDSIVHSAVGRRLNEIISLECLESDDTVISSARRTDDGIVFGLKYGLPVLINDDETDYLA